MPEPENDLFRDMDVKWKRDGEKSLYIETNLDRFFNAIKSKKRMTFPEAQKEFDVTGEQIASWAKIIEDHKLAKVHYPLFGSPVIIFSEKQKPLKETEWKPVRKPGKKAPKLLIALIGGLMVLLGYVMVVSNSFTAGIRLQISMILGRIFSLFSFLPWPLNIIILVAIVVALVWAVAGMRRKISKKVVKK